MFALSVNGWCDEFVVDGIKYSTNEDSISVSVMSNDYEGDIVIPSAVTYNEKTYSVTSIGDMAFFSLGLTGVTIPGSVTSIGELAFNFCPNVISLIVDKENKVYDSRDNCNAIIESQSNTLIAGCMNTVIPNSVTSIGVGAFWDCTGLTSIVIPNSVTSIGQSAFSSCERLTSITIPSSVTSIGWNAFSGCTNLASIVVDKDNKVFDSRDNCNAIIESQNDTLVIGCMNTVIPNGVTGIRTHAFSGCFGLTSITIPGSVKNIGWSAFESCSGLKSVTLQEGVTSIEVGAFIYCKSLTSIVIPSSVTSIGWSAFENCTSLTSIVVDKDNKVFDSRDNCNAIIESQNDTLVIGCMNTVIPNGVTSIGDCAFSRCDGLTSVIIPSSVTSIEKNAFWGCFGLTNITIPNSVTSIGKSAFYHCYGLNTIVCDISTPLTVDSSAFFRVDKSNCVLYVPAGCVDAYKAADVWNEFENIREIDPTAIEGVYNGVIAPDAIYNLRGQKVDGDYRGIVIRKGKKYIFK